ncbi:MAG: acetyl-CoA carboxylase biotin carboxyl carrier protein subunit [Acidobacteria bacterium]|nr:MAG: acetyl-CoA carboxylase biotin carboxyl carrier protein subunit [Acidobacteriota bacterium]MCE7957090.1 acetyl-CoA carboxylase biotin carboxyl carrier protein subunit [Acidobacteria bacterium ACB2]
MKKLRISVNGKVYDVEVQVLEDDERIASPLPLVSPIAMPAPPAPSAPVPGAIPAPLPSGRDADTIRSPIAGTVQKVFVTAGTPVEAKTPVVLLDAMKMDTYIYAPRSGKVSEVAAAPGATVQVGDVLIRFEPEG